MNSADKSVNIYACIAATKSSKTFINNTNPTDTGVMATLLKMKIKEIKLKMMMFHAVLFANKRINRAIGIARIPMISTEIIIGANHTCTPGVAKICFQ